VANSERVEGGGLEGDKWVDYDGVDAVVSAKREQEYKKKES